MEETTERTDERLEKKLRLIRNPGAIVILPRTREGRALVPTVFILDRAVNTIRLSAGATISFEDASILLRRIKEFLEKARQTVEKVSGSNVEYFYEAEKEFLVQHPASSVFIPRTEEGKLWALVVKRLDAYTLRLRTTAVDMDAVSGVLKEFHGLMKEVDTLLGEVCGAAGISYDRPRRLSRFLGEAS